jgi:S-adenosylmethionine hydrolase
LRGGSLPPRARLAAGGHSIAHAQTFSSVPHGAAFWYVNSNGLVEIAVNRGRADRELGLAVASEIMIVG